MSDAIVIRNLVKTFDGFRALDGVNLTVPSGSVYGLVGTNGAGKSSCIRCLAGIYRQDSGDILVDGQPVFENPRNVGAAIATLVHHVLHGEVGIKEELLFANGLADALNDFLNGLFRWCALVALLSGLGFCGRSVVVNPQTLWAKLEDEQGDIAHHENPVNQSHSHGTVG